MLSPRARLRPRVKTSVDTICVFKLRGANDQGEEITHRNSNHKKCKYENRFFFDSFLYNIFVQAISRLEIIIQHTGGSNTSLTVEITGQTGPDVMPMGHR